MNEKFDIKDFYKLILSKWRLLIIFAVIFALLGATYGYVTADSGSSEKEVTTSGDLFVLDYKDIKLTNLSFYVNVPSSTPDEFDASLQKTKDIISSYISIVNSKANVTWVMHEIAASDDEFIYDTDKDPERICKILSSGFGGSSMVFNIGMYHSNEEIAADFVSMSFENAKKEVDKIFSGYTINKLATNVYSVKDEDVKKLPTDFLKPSQSIADSFGPLKRAAMFLVGGGIGGLIFAIVIIMILDILSFTISSKREITMAFNKLILADFSNGNDDSEILKQNLFFAADGKENAKILFTSTLKNELTDSINLKIDSLSDFNNSFAGSLDSDPDCVKLSYECEYVVLVEKLNKSSKEDVERLLREYDILNKKVIGFILI